MCVVFVCVLAPQGLAPVVVTAHTHEHPVASVHNFWTFWPVSVFQICVSSKRMLDFHDASDVQTSAIHDQVHPD